MSKCIDPWVHEVACSTKNLVSSLNLLFYVITKICLYLSFSVTLSFVQVHSCCYLPAISSGFNASTHFHVENPSTVTKPCNSRVTYCNIMVQNGLESNVARFINDIQTCLATNHVFGNCVNTDFWLDKIARESRHALALRHLLQQTFALGRLNATNVKSLL